MRDESASNGIYVIFSAVIFVLALLVFNSLHQNGFRILKIAKTEVEDHQLVGMGEYNLTEKTFTGAELIFDIEKAYDDGIDVYINGTKIGLSYLEKAKLNATEYNHAPFNIIRTSTYLKEYMYDSNNNVIGVLFKTQ